MFSKHRVDHFDKMSTWCMIQLVLGIGQLLISDYTTAWLVAISLWLGAITKWGYHVYKARKEL